MKIVEILLISVSLSMDAFAVSVCKGLDMKRINYVHAVVIALFFGGFQAIMPVLGWLFGSRFERYILDYDHWIAFILLSFLGGKMIYEALCGKEELEESGGGRLDIKKLLIMAVATSIDALAIGVTFAFLKTPIIPAVLIIGVVTFAISFAGVGIGNRFGAKLKKRAELTGGCIMVLIGLKILLEHLEVLVF